MIYEKMLNDVEGYGIKVKEKRLKYNLKGLYKNNKIIINQSMSEKEKVCILAEELGHHFTSYGNIIDQEDVSNKKQEIKARKWSYENLITIDGIINAYNAKITNLHDMAEHFDVTEEFLKEALKHYKDKYGLYVEHKNYIVYFEPLVIVKFFNL